MTLGITKAGRREELKNIKIQDIKQLENMVLTSISETRNNVPQKFVVEGEFHKIFKQYQEFRPAECVSDQFLLCLQNGKCTQQVIGITSGSMSETIAEYLHLEEPENNTGPCFRHTSATLLAVSEVVLLTLSAMKGGSRIRSP